VQGLLEAHGSAANLVNDAHLAALALEHGAELVSYEGDFDRFAGARRTEPAAL
jgi:predicted nucleic acid-binding protein